MTWWLLWRQAQLPDHREGVAFVPACSSLTVALRVPKARAGPVPPLTLQAERRTVMGRTITATRRFKPRSEMGVTEVPVSCDIKPGCP